MRYDVVHVIKRIFLDLHESLSYLTLHISVDISVTFVNCLQLF
uniref:Hypotheticial protein n=1 Tax=Schistosoma japonicum TaxID=6182 RepID=C1LEB3_SCHJA|nr:hypotheticial protein [Schistosoma japonicum]